MPRLLRTASLAAFAWLALAPAVAAKPTAVDRSDPRQVYREQAIAVCVAEMGTIRAITPDGLEAMCGCAVDRFMPRWPTGALPRLDSGRMGPVMGSQLLSCAAAGKDPALAAAVARRLAETAMRAPPAASDPPPGPGKRPEPSSPRFDLRAWFDGLSAPPWLTGIGLPLWAWLPIALLVFALLRALIRRRDSRQDLMGPPRSMRLGGRRPDLPPSR